MPRAKTLALLAAVALAGCGGGGDDEQPAPAKVDAETTAAPVGKPNQGTIVQYADCDDWNKGGTAEKQATVLQLRDQLTPQDDPNATSALKDDDALAILDHACEPSYSGSLRLYKLYVRAQAYAPLNN